MAAGPTGAPRPDVGRAAGTTTAGVNSVDAGILGACHGFDEDAGAGTGTDVAADGALIGVLEISSCVT
ncbi:hypothetical protein BU251_07170 [Candidatus Velamenicoccus archaeovorus]|uniref:Uncharacterized protein n=1 Tax=Velamenicoccus archaeovorus TaxID=1930593 RepID=A0A410P608_VELA1|nr:hypothetical protein BU251_07170 [Candidatus Velamenicoccus archaeovorus]